MRWWEWYLDREPANKPTTHWSYENHTSLRFVLYHLSLKALYQLIGQLRGHTFGHSPCNCSRGHKHSRNVDLKHPICIFRCIVDLAQIYSAFVLEKITKSIIVSGKKLLVSDDLTAGVSCCMPAANMEIIHISTLIVARFGEMYPQQSIHESHCACRQSSRPLNQELVCREHRLGDMSRMSQDPLPFELRDQSRVMVELWDRGHVLSNLA